MSQLSPIQGRAKAAVSTEVCNKCEESTAAMGHIRTNNRKIEVVFKVFMVLVELN